MGLIGYAFKTPGVEEGRKKVVWPVGKSSFRYSLRVGASVGENGRGEQDERGRLDETIGVLLRARSRRDIHPGVLEGL